MKPFDHAVRRDRERLVIGLLMAAYTVNSMDRSIISIVGQSMKADLRLSDTQLGLLGGTAFALLYAFGGIPLGRLAERANRVNIMSIALLVWSSLTALCGAAGSFTQLLLIRIGVGVAESGCSPPAHSLISDYVEPARRASALSVYTCGISLGYILAAVAGGYVTQHLGWRMACVMVGLPGILIAVLIKTLIPEPPRGWSEGGHAQAPHVAPTPSLRAELAELGAVAKTLACSWSLCNVVLGLTIEAFAAYGLYAFVPVYWRRAFGLDYASVGLLSALAGGVAVGIGILAGGHLADRLVGRHVRWYALVPALGGVISLPLYWLAVQASGWREATAWLSLAGFFQYACLGPTFGMVQNAMPASRRGTATALLYICLNVVALGGGPLFAGWAIDRAAESRFHTLPTASAVVQVGATFHDSCPGGAAPAGAAAAMSQHCQATLALATQRGLSIILLFFAWAALHYFLATLGIERSLRLLAQPAPRASA